MQLTMQQVLRSPPWMSAAYNAAYNATGLEITLAIPLARHWQ
jgi:hypothetical protein